jgi:MGT family glycosyltransferase
VCFAAFADSGWHVVLAVGEGADPADLGPAPANVDVAPVVPQLTVLAHAAVFVSYGGMGGIMEALSYGRPVVAIPRTPEQEANASRLAQLGLGIGLRPADVTPTTLREAVDAIVADVTVADRIEQLRYELLTAGGTTRAADVVEACLP